MGKKNDNTLVKNASFLMIAALISKIIGMLYKSPLSNTLGNSSMGLFNYAQNVYFILLMIASFSIPQAVSKIMAEKLAFKRYRDAQKVFHCALLYVVAMGGVVALFCFFGSSILVPESMSGARLALKMLAPTIFLSGILGTFRGYFQAYRNMLPTSLSQIVEQCFVAVFAILMSSVMLNRFSGAEESVRNAWGAAGATMGTGAGVASALLFMLFVYGVNKKTINNEATGEVMKNIVLIVMPIILSSFIYNVNGFINSYMYSGIQGFKGIDHDTITSLYAEYGYYMTLINIPLTLASTAPTSMIPEVSAQYAKHDMDSARDKIDRATWISMFISIPCAVGLAVLAGPITRLLFPRTEGAAAQLMMLGVITIILNGNSNISNGVLQGIGKPNIPMINAAIALVVDVIAMAILLLVTDLGVYSIVIAMIIYAVVMCLLNERAMKKYMEYKNPWRSAYLNPLLASVPMAAVAGFSYYGIYKLIRSNFISLGIAVVLGMIAYFIVYLAVSKPSDEQFAMMPGGAYLKKIASKLPF